MAKQHYSFCHVLQMNPCESKNKKGQAVFYEEYPDAELYMKREPIQQVQHLLSTTKKKKKGWNRSPRFLLKRTRIFYFYILGCVIISFL